MDANNQTDDSLRPVFTNFSHPNGDDVCSTVIIGAGIMGCATAYYLSRSGHTRPDTIHLVEASEELFASASGKAAGFVAEDWFGPATASLGELSFRLHEELARENGGGKAWGYSRTTGTSFVDGGGGSDSTAHAEGDDWLSRGANRAEETSRRDPGGTHEFFSEEHLSAPAWLRRRQGDQVQSITEQGGAAQVDPLRLSQFLLTQALAQGVRLHHPARPLRVALDTTGHLSGLRIRHISSGSEHKIPCTRLVLAAGAWTPRIFATLFPSSSATASQHLLPITPLAGHSIVLRSPRWAASRQDACHALFTTMPSGSSSSSFSPEIFSRMGEEIYVAGLNSSAIPLPDLPADAQPDPAAIDELMRVARRLLGTDGAGEQQQQQASDLQLVREGLCFRPVTRSGDPILVQIPDENLSGAELATLLAPHGGVFVCAGHGPWGISLSLGTGKVMSEMLEGRERSADVGRLGLR